MRRHALVLNMPSEVVGGSKYESARLVTAEPQHKVGRKLVGRVLLVSQNRDLEQIEHCVPDLMLGDIQELPDGCVFVRDPCPRHVFRHWLGNQAQQFIAKGHTGPLVPGVGNSIAPCSLNGQISWQPEWAEKALQVFECPPLLQQIVDWLMSPILGSNILDLDAPWLRLGAKQWSMRRER